MTSTLDWSGKVVIVTGGAGDIGLCAASEWAQLGARVVVVDRDESARTRVLDTLKTIGGQARFFAADVSCQTQVKGYVDQTLEAFGRVDALFNNAGIEGEVAPITEYSEAAFDAVWAVNVKGTFLGMKYVLPHLMRQGSGAIVNMASVAGIVGSPTMSGYSAAKHAIVGLTKTAAGEAGPHGVRVNAVCPGPIKTRMMDSIAAQSLPQAPEELEKRNTARNPLGRYGRVEEIARIAIFLCSDAASWVNGAAWVVDGGRTAI